MFEFCELCKWTSGQDFISVSWQVCLSVCLYVSQLFKKWVYLSVCLCWSVSDYLWIGNSFCLSICLSMSLSFCLCLSNSLLFCIMSSFCLCMIWSFCPSEFVCLRDSSSVCLPTGLSACPSVYEKVLSVYLSMRKSFCLSICLWGSPSSCQHTSLYRSSP